MAGTRTNGPDSLGVDPQELSTSMTLPLIDRYIAKSVIVAIAAVLVCAVSLTGVFALIDEAGGVDQNYTFVNAAAYVLYNLPSQIYESVPFVVFIGSLIGLGTLSTHSEITVLRAAGISLGRLLIPVALPSVLVLTLSLLVAEYVAPWGVQSAAGMKIQQRQVSEDIRFTNVQSPQPWFLHPYSCLYTALLRRAAARIPIS